MALTLSNSPRSEEIFGRKRVKFVRVTFDSSYDAGGESLTPAMVGMSSFEIVNVEPDANALPGHYVQFNYATNKLMVFVEEAVAAGGPLLEIAAASNLSTLVCRCMIVGE